MRTEDSSYIEELTENLMKIKNELSLNGSVYFIAEQRAILDLAQDLVVTINMNLNHGNYYV